MVIAATIGKQLKDRRLETVIIINDALTVKFNALNSTDQFREAKECAEECYTLWAMNHLRHPGACCFRIDSELRAQQRIRGCRTLRPPCHVYDQRHDRQFYPVRPTIKVSC